MLLKSSFPLPQTSGFVAFDGGGTADVDLRRDASRTPAVVITPRAEPELLRDAASVPEVVNRWRATETWQPSSGIAVRRVETVVIVAVCAYFAAGLAGVVGWF